MLRETRRWSERCELGLQGALDLIGEVWDRYSSVNNGNLSGMDGAIKHVTGTLIKHGGLNPEVYFDRLGEPC